MSTHVRSLALSVWAVTVLSGTALAQNPPLASATAPPLTSNRPGISESEALLVPRSFQLESGFTFARFRDDAVRHSVVDLPEATLRFGFTPRFELFANVSNWFIDHRTVGDVSGDTSHASDLSANAKIGWLSEGADPFTLSAVVGLSLPVGSDEISSGGYDPSLRLLWSRSLPRDFAISGNVDVASVTSESDRQTVGAASIGLGHPMTTSTSWFVELFGNVAEGDSQWQLDSGVAIVTSDDVQIDLSGGRTLQRGPAAWFLAGGITIRHRR